MKKIFILLLLMCLSIIYVQAQKTILLKKIGTNRRYEFPEGENIKIKLKEGKEVLDGRWWYENENTIIVSGYSIKLQDIFWIDISEKENGIFLLTKGRDLLVIAGAGYFAVSQINILLETGSFEVDKSLAQTSGALIAGGLACGILDRVFRKRKVKVGKKMFSLLLIDQF